MSVTLHMATSLAPGAVALLQLMGPEVDQVLSELTGRSHWPVGKVFLVDFDGIDQGLAVRLRPDWAQLMPHGGPHVVQSLKRRLGLPLYDSTSATSSVLGSASISSYVSCVSPPTPTTSPAPGSLSSRDLFPEACSELEADMLACLAEASSPRAIDLLTAQSDLWQTPPSSGQLQNLLQRSSLLDRLVTPPVIVVAGPANIGKSTLTNRILGHAASIVADLPGTTRDWVGGLGELKGVAVYWLDTPGLRHSHDPIEQQAIQMAAGAIEKADVLLLMRDAQTDWLDVEQLGREPDLRVLNKVDQPGAEDGGEPDTVLRISAQEGWGVDALLDAVLGILGLAQTSREEYWAFSGRLRQIVRSQDWKSLAKYAQKA